MHLFKCNFGLISQMFMVVHVYTFLKLYVDLITLFFFRISDVAVGVKVSLKPLPTPICRKQNILHS